MAEEQHAAPSAAAAADDERGRTITANSHESRAIHRHHPIARSQPDFFRVGLLPS